MFGKAATALTRKPGAMQVKRGMDVGPICVVNCSINYYYDYYFHLFPAKPAGKPKASTLLQFDSCTLRLRLWL